MKSDTKRYILGIPCAVVMLPVMIAGIVYHAISCYFKAGVHIAGVAAGFINTWLDEE